MQKFNVNGEYLATAVQSPCRDHGQFSTITVHNERLYIA